MLMEVQIERACVQEAPGWTATTADGGKNDCMNLTDNRLGNG